MHSHCGAGAVNTQHAVGTMNPAIHLGRDLLIVSIVFILQRCFGFWFFFFRELIEMLAISRNQKLLPPDEENQVSGFFLNYKQEIPIISAISLFTLTLYENRKIGFC